MSFVPQEEILRALEGDSLLALKRKKDVYREGVCPECNRRSVWIGSKQPWFLRCDHSGSCGYSETIKERYPELFENFAKRFPSTEADPKATARAYMSIKRGLGLPWITELYRQGYIGLPDGTKAETVKFDLVPGMSWERIIEDAHIKIRGKGKNRAYAYQEGATFQNKCWQPPKQVIKAKDTVFIVEGIFCALSLAVQGHKAVAAVTSGNFPRELFQKFSGKEIKWCLAYDNEPGAHVFVERYHQEIKAANEEVEVYLCDKGDFNDALIEDKLTPEFLTQCNWRGRIFIANKPWRRAYAMYAQKKFIKTIFSFKQNLYSAKFSAEEFSKANDGGEFEYGWCDNAFNRACAISCISNCEPQFTYVQHDLLTDTREYFFKILKPGTKKPFFGGFTSNAIADPRAFNAALLGCTDGCTFDGGSGELKILRQRWLNKKITSVESIPYAGYHKESGGYVFQKHGYLNGRLIKQNAYDYLEFDGNGIKTALRQDDETIHLSTEFTGYWIKDFFTVFHYNGIVTLAFFTASLFAQQIKAQQQSFPFLELTGEPGSGKSTLLRFCWKLFGLNHEGVDLQSLSAAAFGRLMGKLSNLPIVAIESDREDSDKKGGRPSNGFNFDIFKKVFDSNAVINMRGVRSNDNATQNRIFRGTLCISQNDSIKASKATMQRIVHLHASKEHQRREHRHLADEFKTESVENLAGYLHQAITHGEQFLDHYLQAFKKHRQHLGTHEYLTDDRVIDCHAQIMAAVDALQVVMPIDANIIKDTNTYLIDRAKSRHRRLSSDDPLVEKFWETYEFINGRLSNGNSYRTDSDGQNATDNNQDNGQRSYKPAGHQATLNHSCNPELIAINLNEFVQYCRDYGQERSDIDALKERLPSCKSHTFIANKKVRSAITGGTVRCWVFKNA